MNSLFKKILFACMFATAAGFCFASDIPQVVTSEVIYKQNSNLVEQDKQISTNVQNHVQQVPTWPIVGSDADVDVSFDSNKDVKPKVLKVTSNLGNGTIVENNFNFAGFSGGANMVHGSSIPNGFEDECENNSEMPLLNREMLEDDGGQILTVSRNTRKKCIRGSKKSKLKKDFNEEKSLTNNSFSESKVDSSEEPKKNIPDQVRSWVVVSNQTLREVLKSWCEKEGWDFVWATNREYPIEASAVFKGRFVDVASALVRNFSRATPTPYAKFYKGNRVLVVSTID